jgi:LysR family nitrogen assimilation transcriptional regulator
MIYQAAAANAGDRLVNLKALQYLHASARYGSIAQAAAHLHVAQPAVSRQIRKLEQDLGVRLLTRTAQGVSPTAEGAHLLARTAPVLQLLEQTRGEVRNWDQVPAGPVSVALMPSVAPLMAPLIVVRVRESYPKVHLHLSEGLGTVIADGVRTGQFDLGLFHADRDIPSLAITHLLDEPMFLIGPATDEHEDDGGGEPRVIAPGELPNYPLLLPEAPNPIRRMIDRLTEDNGLTLDIRETVNSADMIKAMVAAGLGYTIQSFGFFHEETRRGAPQFRAMQIPDMARNWSLARLEGRPAGGAVLAVAGVITEIAREFADTHYRQSPAG